MIAAGTTVINHGICFRTPERILDEWGRDFGIIDLTTRRLEPHFDKVEKMIGARRVGPEEINANNRIFRKGCEGLRLHGGPMTLNMQPCGSCGPCNLGCPEDKKGSTVINYLPAAVQRGARIYRNCRAETIEVEGSKVKAVRTKQVTVRAPIVIVAGGAVNSPALLLSSLEGGAAEVATTHVKPVVMMNKREVNKIDAARFRPNDLTVFSAHPQGGCPMGSDPRRSVVDSECRVHGIDGLYVCDASVFPSPVGINPMISIMALASLTAEQIRNDSGRAGD
jgi:choline dehydrogenase-like flavoprotein